MYFELLRQIRDILLITCSSVVEKHNGHILFNIYIGLLRLRVLFL